MTSHGHGLTEEQRKKIEENRRKALALKAKKNNNLSSGFDSKKCLIQPGSSIFKYSSQPTGIASQRTGKDGSQIVAENHSNVSSSSPVGQKSFQCKDSFSSSNKHGNTSLHAPSSLSKNPSSQTNRLQLQYPSEVPKEKFYGVPEKVMRGKCVLISRDRFCVEVSYYGPLIEFFKQMDTRSYDTSSRTWSFQLGEYDKFIKGAVNFQPDVMIEPLPPIVLQTFFVNAADNGIEEVNLSSVDNKLINTLMPFQKEGVYFALNHGGRILLADEMGLGKTLQALCIASYYRSEWPLLIVTPSSVRYDWAQQIYKWLPSVDPQDVNVLNSGKGNVKEGLISITSYDLMAKKILDLKQKQFRVVIMDESHFLKNSKAVRTKAAVIVSKLAKRIVFLSGTPALSRPIELFTQISAVCPSIFKFHDFGLRYCAAKQQPWGWDYSGSSNLGELQLLLEKKIMIRRQKSDVLLQLPDKTRQVIILNPVLISSNKDLKQAFKIMDTASSKGLHRRESLLQYFHETGKAKLRAVKDFILDLIESNKKFLVFAHHQEMLDCIEDAIIEHSKVRHIRIDGRTKSELRSQLCRKFQSQEDYRVAVLSIMAANAGLNLSAASLVVFAELFWNPGILVQAEDRVHRIGQKNSVLVQYLVARQTADDFIWPLVQDKLNVLTKAGLTKDCFSDADTKHTLDKSQSTIMEIFKQNFIEDSVPTTSDGPQDESGSSDQRHTDSGQVTPVKRKRQRSTSRSPLSKCDSTSNSESPRKRQLRITQFLQISQAGSSSAAIIIDDDDLVEKCTESSCVTDTDRQYETKNVQISDKSQTQTDICKDSPENYKIIPESNCDALLSVEDREALENMSWDEDFWT